MTACGAVVAICARNEQELTEDGLCVQRLANGVYIIGTNSPLVGLADAFIFDDMSMLEEASDELDIDPKLIFGEFYAYRTYTQIVHVVIETKMVHQLTREKHRLLFRELILNIHKRGCRPLSQTAPFFHVLFRKKECMEKKDKHQKRREHVINNGVVNVYKDIVDAFLDRKNLTKHDSTDSRLFSKVCNYFSAETKKSIRTVLNVRVNPNLVYLDANALIYGLCIRALKKVAVLHMMEVYSNPSNQHSDHARTIQEIVKTINENCLYVDQHALSTWKRKNKASGRIIYERDQKAVQCMFNELDEKLCQWVKELKSAGY